MQTLDFQGKKVAFYQNGTKGVPLVFVHGFCEDSSLWEEFLEPFTDEYQIIRIDLPGFGNSEPVENISIAGMSERLLAVLEHLKIQKFIYIGHSMGGYAGLEVVKKVGNQLLGFGMFHSHPFADTAEKKAGRDKSVEFIRRNGHELFVKQFIPGLFAQDFAKSNTFLVDKLIHRASRNPQYVITGALEAMRDRPDNSEVLKNIKCPVLFIIGQLDQSIPFEISLAQTHLPAVGDIHILPNVGHMGMFKAQKETQGIVKNFVRFCLENAK